VRLRATFLYAVIPANAGIHFDRGGGKSENGFQLARE